MQKFSLLFLFLSFVNTFQVETEPYIFKFSIPFGDNQIHQKLAKSEDLFFSEQGISDYSILFSKQYKDSLIIYYLVNLVDSVETSYTLNKLLNYPFVVSCWKDERVELPNADNQTAKYSFPSSPLINQDPLRIYQWYLNDYDEYGFGISLEKTFDYIYSKYPKITLMLVKVGIIDTGIPRYIWENDELKPTFGGGYNFANDSYMLFDDNGHGSHIQGIISAKSNNSIGISGVSSKVICYHYRVFNNGAAMVSNIIRGISAAIDSNVRIINLSLTIQNTAIVDIVNIALEQGIIVIAAMGNSCSETPEFPAAIPNVIAVGSSNEQNRRCTKWSSGSGCSNFGNHIDFLAPGFMIASLNHNYIESVRYMDGTSQSTAIVTGIVSFLLSLKPELRSHEIYDILKNSTLPSAENPNRSWNKFTGWGVVNLFYAVKYLLSNYTLNAEANSFLPGNGEKSCLLICDKKLNLGVDTPIEKGSIKLFDFLGRPIGEDRYKVNINSNFVEIEFENLPEGTYFLTVNKLKYIIMINN